MSNFGGFGHNKSNDIYFKYQATKEIDDKKIPYAKLVRWNKTTEKEEAYEWMAGEVVSVGYMLNKGKPEKGVDPFNELVLTLKGADDAGEIWFYKLPLRASGMAAFAVAKRLHHFQAGDGLHVGAGVIDERPNFWIQAIDENGKRVKLEPVDPGLVFTNTDGLDGAKLAAARMNNAAIREELVEKTVKAMSFYTDGGSGGGRTYESVQNTQAAATASSMAAQAPVMLAEDEYDPFADD